MSSIEIAGNSLVLCVSNYVKVEIVKIHLSKDFVSPNEGDGSTDVIAVSEDGTKYVAAFFAFDFITEQREVFQRSGNFLHGKYFCQPGMILVEDCSKECIRKVVNDLIKEGDFLTSFRQITK